MTIHTVDAAAKYYAVQNIGWSAEHTATPR